MHLIMLRPVACVHSIFNFFQQVIWKNTSLQSWVVCFYWNSSWKKENFFSIVANLHYPPPMQHHSFVTPFIHNKLELICSFQSQGIIVFLSMGFSSLSWIKKSRSWLVFCTIECIWLCETFIIGLHSDSSLKVCLTLAA